MSTKKEDAAEYRIRELERKVAGLQRQVGVINARADTTDKRTERRLRDLEIKAAAQHVPQRKLAEIYDLTPGRISQIVRRVA
ncbi:hypothetical protein [uncultured Sphingomonas sp.]|uniref:hypothetical protein n=1 Tax=uncultured Sphingomonas sp. TaxID=158754 RepID=UPI0025E5A134|nr:hypothetical protein [uncultured Sphingomonas sp.]